MSEGSAALDPVARLMLDEAGSLPASALVIDDVGGGLARALQGAGVRVVACCDDVREAAALSEGVRVLDGLAAAESQPPLADVELVLWRLPRSLDAVDEVAQRLAYGCDPSVRVVAGGRIKHLTPTMNPVLARSFSSVRASLGRQKSRVLHLAGPIPSPPTWPRRTRLAAWDLELVSYGAAFASGRLDAGTELLAAHLPAGRGRALDVGCGTGILATLLARHGWQVSASDVSWAAVMSTVGTLGANGFPGVDVGWHEGVRTEPGSYDLVVSNPPFHRGAAKDSTAAFEIIAGAATALRPGGELWLVFNAHLPYLPFAVDQVGPTEVVSRNRGYVVTRSTKR